MRFVFLCACLFIAACAPDNQNGSCDLVPPHKWTADEQKQMVADETAYLPQTSILWGVIEECAAVRAEVRQCTGD